MDDIKRSRIKDSRLLWGC